MTIACVRIERSSNKGGRSAYTVVTYFVVKSTRCWRQRMLRGQWCRRCQLNHGIVLSVRRVVDEAFNAYLNYL